jgi:hypothetical protein
MFWRGACIQRWQLRGVGWLVVRSLRTRSDFSFNQHVSFDGLQDLAVLQHLSVHALGDYSAMLPRLPQILKPPLVPAPTHLMACWSRQCHGPCVAMPTAGATSKATSAGPRPLCVPDRNLFDRDVVFNRFMQHCTTAAAVATSQQASCSFPKQTSSHPG